MLPYTAAQEASIQFEYLFNEHFSLGGEVEWFYQDVDSDNSNDSFYATTGSGSSKANGTDTRLILRYKF